MPYVRPCGRRVAVAQGQRRRLPPSACNLRVWPTSVARKRSGLIGSFLGSTEARGVACVQVVVAKTYSDFTARRVLTVEWLDGEKLSQSTADDVGTLVNLGVICYLKQLLETGFFHAGAPLPPPHIPTPGALHSSITVMVNMASCPSPLVLYGYTHDYPSSVEGWLGLEVAGMCM